MRTGPPFARADIADAENTRGRRMVLAVKQHVSPERPLDASLFLSTRNMTCVLQPEARTTIQITNL